MDTDPYLEMRHEGRMPPPPAPPSDAALPAVAYACARRARPATVARFRHDVDAALRFIGVMPDPRAAVALVVSEAVTNSVVHGYRSLPPGPVRVCAIVDGGDLAVTVSDLGVGPDPRTDSPGLGVGLAIMRASCDDMTVSRGSPDGGTELMALFRGVVPMSDAGVRLGRAASARDASGCLMQTSEARADDFMVLDEERQTLLEDLRALIAEGRQARERARRLRAARPRRAV